VLLGDLRKEIKPTGNQISICGHTLQILHTHGLLFGPSFCSSGHRLSDCAGHKRNAAANDGGNVTGRREEGGEQQRAHMSTCNGVYFINSIDHTLTFISQPHCHRLASASSPVNMSASFWSDACLVARNRTLQTQIDTLHISSGITVSIIGR
jgi:hypothetical protein